jgi:hypothetical protein|tara:strand:- start:883 stop:1068 length:186 start_codon:yes stop_codon:yes gene_type:complete
MALFNILRGAGRLIAGGAAQKKTYGILKGLSKPSKGGVETMKSMKRDMLKNLPKKIRNRNR